jgi:hypothetical protein
VSGYTGRTILAQQESGEGRSERVEGADGQTGQITNLTADQASALVPEGFTVLYHFSGALNLDRSKATAIQCTNVDETQNTDIEVQLFQYNATSVYTSTTNVDSFETATFESSQVDFYAADVFMNAGFVEQGYGRILTEHKNVICTVQVLDPANSPPTWMQNIPVYMATSHNVYIPAILKDTAP